VPLYTFFTATICEQFATLPTTFGNLTCCSTDNCNVPDLPVLVRLAAVVAGVDLRAAAPTATSITADDFITILETEISSLDDLEETTGLRGLLQGPTNSSSRPVTRCYVEGAKNGTLISADYTHFVSFLQQKVSCLKYLHQCRGEPITPIIKCGAAEVRAHAQCVTSRTL
jgi:hypothetical protein